MMLNLLPALADVLLKIFAAISLFILMLVFVLRLMDEDVVSVEYPFAFILSPQKSTALRATAKARE